MKRTLPPFSLFLRGLLLLAVLAGRGATLAFGQTEWEPVTGSPTTIAIYGPTSVCMGQAASFSAYANGGTCSNWSWDGEDGNVSLSGAQDGSQVSIVWNTAGIRRIALYAGCQDDIGGTYSYPSAYLDVNVVAPPPPQFITIYSYSDNNSPVNITPTSATTCPQSTLTLAPPSGATNCVWSSLALGYLTSDSYGRLLVSGANGSQEYRLTYQLPSAAPCQITQLVFTVNVGVQPYWPEPTSLERYGSGKVVFTLQKYDPTFVYTWYEQETGLTKAPVVNLGGGRFETPSLAASRSYYLSVTTCRESSRQTHPVLLRNVRITVDGQAPTRPVALRYGTGLPLQAEQVDPAYQGPYTWLLHGTVVPNATTARLTVFKAGTYAVRITDSNGVVHESPPVEVIDALAGQTANGQPLTYANEIVVLKPGVTTADELLRLLPTERRQTVTYANGLGQPIQQVAVQAGPAQEDIVQHLGYEGAGTTAQSFLPVPVANLAKANGEYEADPLTKLNNYYSSSGLPYSTSTSESSPLGRPLEQTQTGQAWAGRSSRMSYAGNTATEVRRWQGLDGRQWYPEGQLSKEVALDPDNRRTEVFKDQLGRVVLQRKLGDGQQFDTYTVYADAGYVQAVIPPAAVREMTSTGQWNILDTGFKDQWLYLYTYDDKGRVVERKFPGAAPVYLVYDAFDRPILVQDGNRRAAASKQWLFTKFDAQNRSVVEGLWQDGRTRADVQAAADAFARTQTVEYETRTAGGYTTGNTFPAVQDGSLGAVLLALSFYDDYDLDGNGTADYSLNLNGLSAAEQPTMTTQTRGLTTVTRRRVLQPGGQYGGWLTTVLFYDQYGNVVQKQGNNLLQPATDLRDVTTLVYRERGFVPQLLRTVKKQEYGATTPVVVRNRFAYDPAGRLLHTWQQHAWKNTVEPEVLVSSNRYTGLGELTQKRLHSRDQGAKFLQYEDFAYNQHGQLSRINESQDVLVSGSVSNLQNDLFALNIYREQAGGPDGATPRFDGGISAISWAANNAAQSNQPKLQRGYRFTYDGLGRLTAANYAARPVPWTGWSQEVGAYDEKSITYDANGNITFLERYTQDNATAAPVVLDRLQFGYAGNRPTWVDDSGDQTRGFKERFGSVEYDYDANGSLTRDANKTTSYVYNVLNKTERQTVGTGNVAYTYDASGAVVRKETTTSTIKNEYYVDGFVYEYSPSFTGLRSVPTPEGRALAVQQSDTKLTYEYHLRDHLGNLRVAFRAQAATQELKLSSEDSETEGEYPKFKNIALTRTTSPFNPPAPPDGTKVAAVTSSAPGPFINVPVSHGDRVQVRVYCQTPSGVQYNATDSPSAARVAPQVALALAPMALPNRSVPAPDGRPGARFVPGIQLNVTGLLSALTTRALLTPKTEATHLTAVTTALNAYLAWTLYDNEGNVLQSGRKEVPVFADNLWRPMDLALDIDLSTKEARTGTLRLQELNDASLPVYFDLLTITHPQDQALVSQENHYYPFGMSLSGVAVNTTAQPQVSKDQYNGGSELQDELLGVENGIYSTFYRSYDPTIGRFQSVDPLADEYAGDSPYSFGFNDPINFNDPNGDEPPQTYREAVNQMYGEGWYEQFGRGGTNAAFYGNSAFGPNMGTYNPSIGAAIGGDYYTSIRYATSVVNASQDVISSTTLATKNGQLGFYRSFGSVGYTAPSTVADGVNGKKILLGESVTGMRFHALSNNFTALSIIQPSNGNSTTGNGFDVSNALIELNESALPKSSAYCARYVRQALQAGGINTSNRPRSAKDYGPYLTRWGFHVVTSDIKSNNYMAMRGDIAVFRGYGKNPHGAWNGHIQMYNGNQWVSDFKQNHFTPGAGYSQPPVPYIIYRW